MKRTFAVLAICSTLAIFSSRASADATFTVDGAAPWLGYMNVFESLNDPINPGGYLWGSAWGVPALVSVFDGATLTLSPNSIEDPSDYWYVGGGAPGSPGNKIMDANTYVELATGTFAGELIKFEGNVLSNTLSGPHTARAFIRDFAPDYSSYNESFVDLTPGAFSIELFTDPGVGRHIQYGFNFNGPNVWITDLAPFGNVKVAVVGAAVPGDFNDDGIVDGQDLLAWQRGQSPTALSATDLNEWKSAYVGTLAAAIAVPEPAGISLLIAISGLMVFKRNRV